MRRIPTWCGTTDDHTILVSKTDLRLMRAVVRTLERIAQMPSPECARDPFLCKSLARQAMDAFNKGARKP